jgi:two-component system, OmpR family, response regulator
MPFSILIADPDPDSRDILSMLFRHAGYAVETATEATEAERLVRAHRPVAALLDHYLPSDGGYVFAQRLLTHTARPRPVVVFMTTDSQDDTRAAAVAAGCDCVFIKPIDPRHLLACLQSLLSVRHADTPTP